MTSIPSIFVINFDSDFSRSQLYWYLLGEKLIRLDERFSYHQRKSLHFVYDGQYAIFFFFFIDLCCYLFILPFPFKNRILYLKSVHVLFFNTVFTPSIFYLIVFSSLPSDHCCRLSSVCLSHYNPFTPLKSSYNCIIIPPHVYWINDDAMLLPFSISCLLH